MFKGSVYNPKADIKQSIESFGIATGTHDFIFPYLAVYDTEASLSPVVVQPTAKRVKMYVDVDGVQVEHSLKLTSTHQLLS